MTVYPYTMALMESLTKCDLVSAEQDLVMTSWSERDEERRSSVSNRSTEPSAHVREQGWV